MLPIVKINSVGFPILLSGIPLDLTRIVRCGFILDARRNLTGVPGCLGD